MPLDKGGRLILRFATVGLVAGVFASMLVVKHNPETATLVGFPGFMLLYPEIWGMPGGLWMNLIIMVFANTAAYAILGSLTVGLTAKPVEKR
jgi:hypothetical protein